MPWTFGSQVTVHTKNYAIYSLAHHLNSNLFLKRHWAQLITFSSFNSFVASKRNAIPEFLGRLRVMLSTSRLFDAQWTLIHEGHPNLVGAHAKASMLKIKVKWKELLKKNPSL